jgi:flagellum-specific peptidoglycan hydrolase FlgJ
MAAQPTSRSNGRTTRRNLAVAEARCPYCGQSITHQEFDKIRSRIEAEERTRIAQAEQTLRDKYAQEKEQAATKAKAEIDRAKKDAAAQVEKAKREVAAREAAIRHEATKAATAALAPKIAGAVAVERKQAFAEKLRLNAQLEGMKREIERSRPEHSS